VHAALSDSADVAICIIGGGFADLATAISLIERGERHLLLLEAETVGHGASGRNGGRLLFRRRYAGVFLANWFDDGQ
jgi:glycine/D-amino acid oxidase-like deaminating enzyme